MIFIGIEFEHFLLTHKVTTTPDQSWLASKGSEGLLHIPLNSRTRASASDGLVSYPGHLLGSYISTGMTCLDDLLGDTFLGEIFLILKKINNSSFKWLEFYEFMTDTVYAAGVFFFFFFFLYQSDLFQLDRLIDTMIDRLIIFKSI